jgi:hypothetical protein
MEAGSQAFMTVPLTHWLLTVSNSPGCLSELSKLT